MITKHQYLKKHPINKDSKKLIVGTIHPHHHENFIIPFFYGNKLSLWNILNEVFDNSIGTPISVEGILNTLSANKISISDTIVECKRTSNSSLDKDLIPLKLNHHLVDQIKESQIEEILFTSGFAKNNAFRLFYKDILGLRITKDIKENRGIVLDASIFGRPIKLTVLYSPSGTANTGIVRSKLYLAVKNNYNNSTTPVQDFKVAHYREHFLSPALID
ncbi:hypothetical protein [Marinifilum flexuosum]|uniref:hypothetical protein n=1 Tax=Marinifilum flexuosum TaxID=1117708 RepID=UPI00248F50BC|nr:hypothetical protein [Marinifilum flexuosum]